MKLLNLILLCFLISACAKEQMNDCFTPLGEVVTVTRQLQDFEQIKGSDVIEVILIQDSSRAGEVEIIAPENLIPQIKTEVEDAVLHLRNTNTCNFVRSYNYTIVVKAYFKQLSQLVAESASKFTSHDTLYLQNLRFINNALSTSIILLNADEVFIQSKNSSETILKGRAKVLKGTIEEVSNLEARTLVSDEVLIDTHTPYDCFIQAQKGIYVNIYNSGNIFYLEEPTEYKLVGTNRGGGRLQKK